MPVYFQVVTNAAAPSDYAVSKYTSEQLVFADKIATGPLTASARKGQECKECTLPHDAQCKESSKGNLSVHKTKFKGSR